jgi:tRNA-binding protein
VEVISYDDFAKVDMRVGIIVHAEDFPRARNPSYKVQVDFGAEIGVKWSSVQAKRDYTLEELLGRQVIGVVNFPPKNIAGFQSEALLLGVIAEDSGLSLLMPDREAKIGTRVY